MVLITTLTRAAPLTILILLSTLLTSLSLTFLSPFPADAATTRIVGSGGYSTISAAVSASANGDTIRVKAGTYREQVNVSKDITVQAYGDGQPWIDGECSRSFGMVVGASGATVTGIGIKRSDQEGVRIDGGDDITLDGMTIQDYNCLDLDQQYAAGIASWFNSSRLEITNSTITRRVQLAGPARGFGNGIWIKNTSASTGGGHYIAGNTIAGGYDGIGGEPEGVIHGGLHRDSTIENNLVSDCWDDGIQVEGGNINVMVRENTVDGCAIGIGLAPTLRGPLYIERNTIIDLVPGYYGAMYAFKIGDSNQGTVYFTENIVDSPGDGFKQGNSGLPTMIARGNIINVDRRVIEFSDDVPNGSSFDYDCLWSSDPNRFIIWEGDDYYTVSSFRSATGNEANGTHSPDCGSLPAVDADGDGVPDAQDNCPNWPNPSQALPAWPVAANDPDCDGFSTAMEVFLGTDPFMPCAATTGANNEPNPDRWPADFNDNRRADLSDLGLFGGHFNSFDADQEYAKRFDLNVDDRIDLSDLGRFGIFFNRTCTP